MSIRKPTTPKSSRSHNVWSACFVVISCVIVMTMMLPAYFGFQKFTQWGAMYTDSWCRMDVYSGSPHTGEEVESEWVLASTVGPGAVFSSPMHNFQSCLMWARKVQCGRVTEAGWTVAWVSPDFKGKHFLDPYNACDVPVDPDVEWFRSQL